MEMMKQWQVDLAETCFEGMMLQWLDHMKWYRIVSTHVCFQNGPENKMQFTDLKFKHQ
jgi:hypothetical protein